MSQTDEKKQELTAEEMKAEIESLASKVGRLQADIVFHQMKVIEIMDDLLERIAKTDPVVRTTMAQIFTEMGMTDIAPLLEEAAQELKEQKSNRS